MIQATIAYQKTKFQKQIVDFKADIEEEINKAISEGKYECEVMFDSDLPDSIREEIGEELSELGYDYKMPPFEAQPNVPCDQARYYDYLDISWDKRS